MSELAFVTNIYRKVLLREPDAGGVQYWTNQILLGGINRDTVTAVFLNGGEFQNVVAPIVRLYENLLGRAPDAGGVEYWAGLLRAGKVSLHDITTGFLKSAEASSLGMGPAVDNAAFVKAMYRTMGRTDAQIEADKAGVDYWVNQLNTYKLDRAGVATIITESPENVVSSAGYVTGYAALRFVGIDAPGTAQLNAFSATASSIEILTAAKTVTDNTTLPTGTGTKPVEGGTAGQTFTLTKNADSLLGTRGNDTFNASVIDAGGGESSYTAGDRIEAGGGIDTLFIAMSGTRANGADTVSSSQQLVGVEKVLVNNFAANNAAGVATKNVVNVALADGALHTVGLFSSSAQGDTEFTGMKSILNAEMANGSGDLTLTYDADAVSGTADVQKLKIDGATGTVVPTFTAAGVETIEVSAWGTASKVSLGGNDYNTVKLAGSAKAEVTAGSSALKAVDASAATGDMTIVATVSTQDLTITGGKGNDTIIVGQGNFSAKDVIDGGDGKDTLQVRSTATGTPSVTFGTVKNVEALKLEVTGAANAAGTPDNRTLTADMSKVAGVTDVVLENSQTHTHTGFVNEAATFTLNNVAADTKVTVLAASGKITETTGNTTKQNEGATNVNVNLKDATGTSDVVTIKVGEAGKADVVRVGTVSAVNVETVNYVVQGTGNVSVSNADAAGNKTVNISGGTSGKTATFQGLDVATTINAAEFAGKLVLDLGDAKHTVTGGKSDDIINVSLANLTADDKIDGGEGSDRLALGKIGQTSTAASVLDFTTSSNALKLSGLKNIEAIEIDRDSNVKASDAILSSFTAGEIKFVAKAYDDNGNNDADVTTTFDASGVLTPGTKVVFDGSSDKDTDSLFAYTVGNAIDTFIGGAGNDTVTVSSVAFLGSSDSITGGAGKDTLVFSDATAQTNKFGEAQLKALNGVEVIDINIDTSANLANYEFTLTNTVMAQNWDATNKFTITGADDVANKGTLKVDASALSSSYGVILTGGTANDTLIGGAGDDVITGGAGKDTINLSAGGSDIIVLPTAGGLVSSSVDTITGFTAGDGAGKDIIRFTNADTTLNETTGGAVVLVEASVTPLAAAGAVTLNATTTLSVAFNSATGSVLELKGLTSAANLDLADNGVELLKGLGAAGAAATGLTAANTGDKFFIVAYDNNNAYLYHAASGLDATVSASEIALVGIFNGVEEGALKVDNFAFV